MNALLERIYSTGQVEDADGNFVSHSTSSITFETGMLLYDLIRRERHARTLEIGMAYGLATLFMCQAHHDNGTGHHTVIDPYEITIWRSIGLLNVTRAGLDSLLRFYEAPSCAILPQLWAEGEHFDFAFIDGAHLFDYVMLDFFYVDKVLKVGGHMAFDDLWMPAVRKAVAFVLKNRAYVLVPPSAHRTTPLWRRVARAGRRIIQDALGSGLALKLVAENVGVVQKVAEDQRPWDFHRSF